MKVIIVEDELLAMQRLQTMLKEYDGSIQIIACLESVEETVHYLSHHAHPDVMLLDIHLSDGHSFDIFRLISYNKAVIFTTAYDKYALDAFKMFSVDYILKPVTLHSLAGALNKFKEISASFAAADYRQLVPSVQPAEYKKRFLGKVGTRLFFLETSGISVFQAENKIVYMADMDGKRYVVDYTMEKLEDLLDPRQFFRLNRKFIVQIGAIEQVKPYFNNRLKLVLKGWNQGEDMIVSRERVSLFRQWAEN